MLRHRKARAEVAVPFSFFFMSVLVFFLFRGGNALIDPEVRWFTQTTTVGEPFLLRTAFPPEAMDDGLEAPCQLLVGLNHAALAAQTAAQNATRHWLLA